MVESYLPEGSWLSIVDFDDDAIPLSNFVQVDSTLIRQTLVSKIPREGRGGTCIPCGTDLALSVSSTYFRLSTEGKIAKLSFESKIYSDRQTDFAGYT